MISRQFVNVILKDPSPHYLKLPYGLPANIEGKLKHWRGVSGIFCLGGPWMLGFGKLFGV